MSVKLKSTLIGDYPLPTDRYAVGATAILGIRDSGKTVTAKGIAEQLLDQGIPIIVYDAVGRWRFMKSRGPGPHGRAYKLVVAGGRDPDIPLTPKIAPEIVRAAMKQNIPLIFDLYDHKLSKADWREIVLQTIRIIHYENEGIRHVFLEEAAEYCPQRVTRENGHVFSEVEKLVRMGGNASVGITLISQRAQEVNKSVLDLCENLVLGCQIGSKAIQSIETWMDKLSPETAAQIIRSLPSLQAGNAWLWTKAKPELATRVTVPMCLSLHPDRRDAAKKVAKVGKSVVDVSQFVSLMSETLKSSLDAAAADDPRQLKRQLEELRRQLKQVDAQKSVPAVKPAKPVRPLTVSKADLGVVERAAAKVDKAAMAVRERLERATTEIVTASTSAVRELGKLVEKFNALTDKPVGAQSVVISRTLPPAAVRPAPAAVTKPVNAQVVGDLGKGEFAVLTAVAQHENGCTRGQISVLTGFKQTTRNTYVYRLAQRGLVVVEGGRVEVTQEGRATLGPQFTPLPTGRALRDHWLSTLPDGEARVLRLLVDVYPNTLSRAAVGESTGFKQTTNNTYIYRLIRRELVVDAGTRSLMANPTLFGE